jgi:RND family efflux transporter MFP subunit
LEKEALSALKIDLTKKRAGQAASRTWRRRGTYVVILLGLGLLGYLLSEKIISASAKSLELGTVAKMYPYEAFSLLVATGYVVPQVQADVATKATGRLEWLDVEEGSKVKKGQLIARLDNQDVKALNEKAAAEVNVAEGRLAEADAELRDATRSLARVEGLIKRAVTSQDLYDTAIARQEKAVAVVQSGKAAVASAQATFHGTLVDVESTLIRAPFDGVVLRKYANIGDVVAPFSSTVASKGAVISMADLETLEVEVDVSESELHKVHPGQPCQVELDALPDSRFRCAVSRIVPTVDKARATVLVRVRFIDKDERTLPNMSARVTFLSQEPTADENRQVTVVPQSAVVKRKGAEVAFLVRDNTVSPVTVETGRRIGDVVEIRLGLTPGDQVVLRPPENLEAGAKIDPFPS